VVAVLLASAGVAAGRLQVRVGARADPDVGPGRRDDERLDATEIGLVAKGGAVRFGVTEGIALAVAAYAGSGIGDVAEPGGTR